MEPDEMTKEIKAEIEKITKSVTQFQTEFATVKGDMIDGAEYKEKSDKWSLDIATATESLQKMVTDAEAEKAHVKELELTIAKMVSDGPSDSKELKVDDDIKAAFSDVVKRAPGTYVISPEVAEKNVKQHVEHYFGYLTDAQKDLAVKGLISEGSNPAGGIWCPITLSTKITKRVFELTPMRELATVLNTNTQAMEFALDDEEIETLKATEISTRTQTDTPEFGKVKIDVHEQYAYPLATVTQLEDSTFNMESYISGRVANKFSRVDGYDSILGLGADGMKGILQYADAAVEVYERNKLGVLTSAATATVGADDLIDLQSHLLEAYQANATWLVNRLIWAVIMKLKDAVDGQYLLNPTLLFSGAKPQLLGAPVRMAGDMPSVQTAGTKAVAYGDFREAYTITDRIGISVVRDNITRPGFVKWNYRRRTGGGVTNFQAIKILKTKT